MEESGLDHVGAMFGIESRTLAERMCCPVLSAIAFLALSLSAYRSGAGTGAFNMLRRETYEALGGHTRLRNEILDDVGLARLVSEDGYQTSFVDLSRQVSVRLFVGLRGFWQAIGRSAIPFLSNSVGSALFLSLITFCLTLSSTFSRSGILAGSLATSSSI